MKKHIEHFKRNLEKVKTMHQVKYSTNKASSQEYIDYAIFQYEAIKDVEMIIKYKPREVLTTADNLSMLKMIHSLRADYFFIAHEEAEQLIAESPFKLSDFKYINFSNMPEGNKRFIICTQKVPDSIIAKLNRAIRDSISAANNKSRK